MNTLREAAQQALEVLEFMADEWGFTQKANRPERWQAIEALKAALKQPEQDNFPEEKLQAVAEYFGDKYHVWYGIGARDVEEVLLQSVRRGLVTLNFDTGEQPEQEPVAWQVHPFDYGIGSEGVYAMTQRPDQVKAWERKGWTVQPLYTHPHRREWQSLSEEEVFHVENNVPDSVISDRQWTVYFARAIEAALKERNA